MEWGETDITLDDGREITAKSVSFTEAGVLVWVNGLKMFYPFRRVVVLVERKHQGVR